MREASRPDEEYIAECFVNISRYIKSQASDIYIDGLPDSVDQRTLERAKSYVNDDDAVAFIEEREGQRVACIAARIENTSFSPSGVGPVGNIAICWVAQEYRAQSIGRELVRSVEDWFLNREVNIVELSYLAQNSLAEMAWRNLGYVPFRVYSYKVLKNA